MLQIIDIWFMIPRQTLPNFPIQILLSKLLELVPFWDILFQSVIKILLYVWTFYTFEKGMVFPAGLEDQH